MPKRKEPPNPSEPMYERRFAIVVCPREFRDKYWPMKFDEVCKAAERGEDGLVLTKEGNPEATPGQNFCSMRMLNHPGSIAHGHTSLVEQRWSDG